MHTYASRIYAGVHVLVLTPTFFLGTWKSGSIPAQSLPGMPRGEKKWTDVV